MTRTRQLLGGLIVGGCLSGCAPQPLIAPMGTHGPEAAERMAESLGGPVSCDVDGALARCVVDGTKMSLQVALSATGRQLWMVVLYEQPSCARPAYHARIQKYNAQYFMVGAACLDKTTLVLSHRSHLFRAGLGKEELQQFVEYWVALAVGSASTAGLIGAESSEATPEEPAGSKA